MIDILIIIIIGSTDENFRYFKYHLIRK